MKSLIMTLAMLFSFSALPHAGGTDANGCHVNSANGRKHCHDGSSVKKKSKKKVKKAKSKVSKAKSKVSKTQANAKKKVSKAKKKVKKTKKKIKKKAKKKTSN